MKTPKTNSKPKASSRKSVVQAIAKQQEEVQSGTVKNAQDLHQAICLKAYELYVERGCVHGNHVEDWIAAEKIVRQTVN